MKNILKQIYDYIWIETKNDAVQAWREFKNNVATASILMEQECNKTKLYMCSRPKSKKNDWAAIKNDWVELGKYIKSLFILESEYKNKINNAI